MITIRIAPSKEIFLSQYEIRNTKILCCTSKICTFNRRSTGLRCEYFQGMLQWLFKLF